MNTVKTLMVGLVALFVFVFAGHAMAEETTNTAKDPAAANTEAMPADEAAAPAVMPKDTPGTPAVEAVKAQIKEQSKASGTLDLFDDKLQKVRTLDMMDLKQDGDKVTGHFRDTKSGDVVSVEVPFKDNKAGDFVITGAEAPQPVKTAKKDYTDQEVQDFMKDYLTTQAQGTGSFDLFDEKNQKMRHLEFVKLQEKVRRYGIIAISTAEFKDKDTGDTILADVNTENKDGLNVTAVRIKNVIKGQAASDAAAPSPSK